MTCLIYRLELLTGGDKRRDGRRSVSGFFQGKADSLRQNDCTPSAVRPPFLANYRYNLSAFITVDAIVRGRRSTHAFLCECEAWL